MLSNSQQSFTYYLPDVWISHCSFAVGFLNFIQGSERLVKNILRWWYVSLHPQIIFSWDCVRWLSSLLKHSKCKLTVECAQCSFKLFFLLWINVKYENLLLVELSEIESYYFRIEICSLFSWKNGCFDLALSFI